MPAFFSWINLVDTGTVTGTAPLGGTALANVQRRQLSFFYAPSTPSAFVLDIDVSASVWRVLAIAGTFSAGAAVRGRFSATAFGNTDQGDTGTVTVPAATVASGIFMHLRPAAGSARFVRLDFTGGPGAIGRVWIGDGWVPAANVALGFGKAWLDGGALSAGERTGAVFADTATLRRPAFDAGFDALSDADFDALDDMLRSAGTTGQIFFCGETAVARAPRLACFGRVADINPIAVNLPGSTAQWARTLRIEGEG